MRFYDLLATAFGNLGRHKLRTALTVAGVTIGTATLALMVSVAAGLQLFVVEQTVALSPKDIVYITTSQDVGGIRFSLGSIGAPAEEVKAPGEGPARARTMAPERVAELKRLPHVRALYGNFNVNAESVRLSGAEKSYQVRVTPAYPGSRTVELVAGRDLGGDPEETILAYQYLSVFGWEKPEDALGQTVEIVVARPLLTQSLSPGKGQKMERERFRAKVVGVTARTAESRTALVPYEYALEMVRWQFRNRQFLSPNDWGTTGVLHVDSPEHVDEVAESVRQLGMGALTPADQLGIVNTAYMYLEGVLSLVGIISLVVASLGISNTLYMAIYERTREIGVWKAVGATKATVRTLFTLEAGAIGLLGGAAGLAVAWTVGQGINAVARATFAQDFASFALSAFPSWLVLAVLGFSVLIGVLAGLLPATRAAGLDPVAALRQE